MNYQTEIKELLSGRLTHILIEYRRYEYHIRPFSPNKLPCLTIHRDGLRWSIGPFRPLRSALCASKAHAEDLARQWIGAPLGRITDMGELGELIIAAKYWGVPIPNSVRKLARAHRGEQPEEPISPATLLRKLEEP